MAAARRRSRRVEHRRRQLALSAVIAAYAGPVPAAGPAALAALAAALVTWLASLAGLRLFPDFRSREQKAGEYRRDAVPAAVAGSSRLPCVVGPAMLLGLTVALLPLARARPDAATRLGYLLALCWAEGLLGWYDDLRKSRGLGLGERVRLLAHMGIALAAAAAYLALGFAGGVGAWAQAGSALVVLVAFPYVVLSTGFTDGVDGLTAGFTTLSGVAFALLAALWGGRVLGAPAAAVAGMGAGALLVNTPSNWTRTGKVARRARGYLGDSGALVAGAAVAALAIVSGAVALLPLLAAGVVVEGSAVFLQTGLLTPLFRRGLRLRRFRDAATLVPHTEFPLPFLATPLHHHLNLIGLRPLQVCAFLWGLQGVATVLGLAAALAAAPWLRAGLWLAGLLALLLPAAGLAATRPLFLTRSAGDDGAPALALCRGLPWRLWSLRLYRPVERLPGVPPEGCGALLDRPLPRYEAFCRAALAAERAGRAELAADLLRRVPVLNLLLRPEAALLATRGALGRGELAERLDTWRRALRPLYQEGRLDLVLGSLARLAEEGGEAALALALRTEVRAAPPAAEPPRWR